MQGAGYGIQGAQAGLQGVQGQQAGYNLSGQQATNLSNIGTSQLAAQTGIIGLQNQLGAQQQAQQQNVINQAIQNYANAQQYPMQQLNAYNALLRGYAVPGQTATQYQAAPSLASQVGGLGTAGVAAAKLASMAKGGEVESDGLDTLGLYNVMKKEAA